MSIKKTSRFDFASLGVPKPGEPTASDHYADDYEAATQNLLYRVVWVTPQWAAAVLSHNNTQNRAPKLGMTAQLASYIRAGQWRVNGESIIFAEDGTLLDGQHRLMAVVQSETPVPCLCVFGVDKETFQTLDETPGRRRRDVLSIPRDGRTESNINNLAAALGWLYRWEQGQMSNAKCVLSNHDTFRLLDQHPGIRHSVCEALNRCRKGVHAPALFVALHYIFGLKHPAKRDTFFRYVLDREEVPSGSICAILNKWLENAADGTSNRNRGAYATVVQAAVVIKSWNIFLNNMPPVKVLKYQPDETFPAIQLEPN